MVSKLYRKFLKLPSPKDLGRSPGDYLPMRSFDPFEKGYSWEDWHEEMRSKYPIRYFLFHTLMVAISIQWEKVTDFIYMVKCHVLPSYRFHLIDIRRPGPDVPYIYGWCGISERLLYASMVLLSEYVEQSDDFDELIPNDCTSETVECTLDPDDEAYNNCVRAHLEAKDIHRWWTVDRLKDEKALDESIEMILMASTKEERMQYIKRRLEMTSQMEAKQDEMLARLLKIRHYL